MDVGSVDGDEMNESGSNEESADGVEESIVDGNATENVVTNKDSETNNTVNRIAFSNQSCTWIKGEILAVDHESWSWPPNFLRTRSW